MFLRNKKQQQRIAILIVAIMLGATIIGAFLPLFYL